MKLNKGSLAPIIIILGLIVIAFIIVGIFVLQYEQHATESDAEDYMEKAEAKLSNLSTTTPRKKLKSSVKDIISLSTKATDLKPNDSELWFRRGNIYFEILNLGIKGAKQKSIKCYNKALELRPDNKTYQRKLEEVKEMEVNP